MKHQNFDKNHARNTFMRTNMRMALVKRPPRTQSDSRIRENTSGEITKSDRPGTQSDSRIIENTSGEITKTDRPCTQSDSRNRENTSGEITKSDQPHN